MATEVRTQKQLDEALARGDLYIDLVGDGVFAVTATGSSQVRAYGSSQVTAYDSSQVTANDSSQVTATGSSQVRAYGSSQVTANDSSQVTATGSSQVRAYGSSQVRAYGSSQVTAYGSSQVTANGSSQVTAYGSSQVRAYGSSQVTAYGSSQVRAYGSVAVTAHEDRGGNSPTVTGGVLISVRRATTGREWADFYGIPVTEDGIAVLYKAVEADWKGSHKHPGISYAPGATPEAHDWDPSGRYGGGLHLVPRPPMGDQYLNVWPAAHYVGCPVRIDDVVLLDDKVKVRGLAAPCFEVDVDGEPIPAAEGES